MATCHAIHECICGESIEQVTLPKSIAEASGETAIWVHVPTSSTLCYEDDPDCHAEPAAVHCPQHDATEGPHHSTECCSYAEERDE